MKTIHDIVLPRGSQACDVDLLNACVKSRKGRKWISVFGLSPRNMNQRSRVRQAVRGADIDTVVVGWDPSEPERTASLVAMIEREVCADLRVLRVHHRNHDGGFSLLFGGT